MKNIFFFAVLTFNVFESLLESFVEDPEEEKLLVDMIACMHALFWFFLLYRGAPSLRCIFVCICT